MKDGVFTYKREWGTKVEPNRDMIRSSIFALKLCNFENVVREFLAHNPLIFTDFEGLRGLIFINPERPTEGQPKDYYRLHYTLGLSDLVVVCGSTKNASSSVFKVTPESRILDKCFLGKDAPNTLEFLTILAPNMSFNSYIMDAPANAAKEA